MKTKKSKVLIMLSIAVIFFISSNSSYCDAYSVKYKTTTNSQEKETINESYNSRKVAYITIDDGPQLAFIVYHMIFISCIKQVFLQKKNLI